MLWNQLCVQKFETTFNIKHSNWRRTVSLKSRVASYPHDQFSNYTKYEALNNLEVLFDWVLQKTDQILLPAYQTLSGKKFFRRAALNWRIVKRNSRNICKKLSHRKGSKPEFIDWATYWILVRNKENAIING